MSQYLSALSLRYYRGIGGDTQRVTGFRKFNFFIGANNAGKSIVLNFLSRGFLQKSSTAIDEIERFRGLEEGNLEWRLGFAISDVLKLATTKFTAKPELLSRLISGLSESGYLWLNLSDGYEVRYTFPSENWQMLSSILEAYEWQGVWNVLTKQSRGELYRDWVPQTINHIVGAIPVAVPEVRLIPAKRQIGPTGAEFSDLSGVGLIDELAKLQSPEHGDYQLSRAKFDKINLFLADVTDHPEARIEIPYSRSSILVHMNRKVLPLSSLGTGIHEVVLIAAFATVHEECIMCIEEPEIHLHPILQRKLIKYLEVNTKNQYFIATHSASFIDTPGAAVFHVTNDGNQTYIRGTQLQAEKFSICMDLGYRASDIIQANCVIWVEGPSDRIYVKHWLSSAAPEFIEGTHFSIMFYGGRLLSHLSGDSEPVDDFIRLRTLNQHSAIIMDSDRKAASSPINDTKKRLRDQFASDVGLAWVTKGREIENYINFQVLQHAVKRVHQSTYGMPANDGSQFDHALHFIRNEPKRKKTARSGAPVELTEKNVDKVAVAHMVAEHAPDWTVLDLRKQVDTLIEFIRRANR